MNKLFGIVFAVIGIVYAASALAATNINTATAEELVQLDGVGQVRAEAIVKNRQDNGPYQSLDQLTRVNGIGQKTVEAIRDEATVGQASPNEDSAND